MSGHENAAQTEDEIIWLHRHRPGNYSVKQLRKRRQQLASSVTGSLLELLLKQFDPMTSDSMCFFLSCLLLPHVFWVMQSRRTLLHKLASVIFTTLVKMDPSLKNCFASDLQCPEEPQVLPKPPWNRSNAFFVENEKTKSDDDGRGSASHDQCQCVLLVYDDDSTLIVDEDFYQVDKSLFQLNTI